MMVHAPPQRHALALALIVTLCASHAAALTTASEGSITANGAKNSDQSFKRVGYPYYPGGGDDSPSPDAPGVLPITSGSIVSMTSRALSAFCAPGDKSDRPAYVLKCDTPDDDAEPGSQMLVIGKDYMTQQIKDGGTVYLKAQSSGKFCSVGDPRDGAYMTCSKMHYDSSCEFMVHLAGEGNAIRLTPAKLKGTGWCRPEMSVRGEARVYCDAKLPAEKGDEVFVVKAGGYPGPGGGGQPGGGGDSPGGGYWPGPGGGDSGDSDSAGGGGYPGGGGDGKYPDGKEYPHGAPDDGGDGYPGQGGPSGDGGNADDKWASTRRAGPSDTSTAVSERAEWAAAVAQRVVAAVTGAVRDALVRAGLAAAVER